MVISLCLGPSDIASFEQVIQWLEQTVPQKPAAGPKEVDLIRIILWDVRLPRILLTFMVGSALSMSGNALQALFRNPLVSPYVLGVSSGSAFGASLAILIPLIPLQASAFGFGLLAAGLSYCIARSRSMVSVTALVLSGVIISSVFTAFLALIQFSVDSNRLQAIVHWALGNLHTAGWPKIISAGPLIMGSALALFLLSWRMNLLAMGDEEVRAMGINPERDKVLILIPAVLATSAAIAVAGVIGFLGLVVPHIIRMLIGPDNQQTTPACFAFGGVFLVLVDNFSRTLAPVEIPVGIFTTILGAPLFIYLLRKSRIGWDI